jgi:uncharacterized membrane-anchored protein
MTRSPRHILFACLVVALAQSAALSWMVFDRVLLLKHGREITLPIVPVDPRDLFRGDYARLGYDISRLPRSLLDGPAPARNAPFYVTLQRGNDGVWKPLKVTRDYPADLGSDRVVLKARVHWTGGSGFERAQKEVFAHYGIESYFVPEGTGIALEKLARERKLAAVIAVDSKGNAAIKGLSVEGALKYEEPLF